VLFISKQKTSTQWGEEYCCWNSWRSFHRQY